VTGGSNSMGHFPYLSTITWTDNDLDQPDKTRLSNIRRVNNSQLYSRN